MFSHNKFLITLVYVCILLHLCCGAKKDKRKQEEPLKGKEVSVSSDRTSRNLFPFVWVTFQPSPCGSSNEGVCVQRGKCTKRGGQTSGTCRDGFGECCTFKASCNETIPQVEVNQLVTLLETPNPTNAQCTFKFKKEPNICQIRLDFIEGTMASANNEGNCVTDRLRVSGSITVDNDFTTCGNLLSQHMYLTFGSQDTIELTPLLKASGSRYKILATRIPCDSKNRAPDYCLQYFKEPSGTVKSFDFGKQQQNNQQYRICVKPLSQSPGVQWSTCSGVTDAFNIVTDLATDPVPPPCTDWVQPNGENRLCRAFGNMTCAWKPYDLLVNFDDEEIPPPPPVFDLPVDPENCSATCKAPVEFAAILDCDCIPGVPPNRESCQCTPKTAANNPFFAGRNPDIDNKGFCLEYTQL